MSWNMRELWQRETGLMAFVILYPFALVATIVEWYLREIWE